MRVEFFNSCVENCVGEGVGNIFLIRLSMFIIYCVAKCALVCNNNTVYRYHRESDYFVIRRACSEMLVYV